MATLDPVLGLTKQYVMSYVAESGLAAPAIQLHVTATQFNNEMDYVLNVFSRRKPRIRFATIMAQPGKQDYLVDPNKVGYGVVGLMIPRLDPIAPLLLSAGPRLDIFGYRYSYPYRDIAELEIDYMYFDMATRTLSSEIDWEFIRDDDNQGRIWFYPAPVESFQFAYAYAAPKMYGDEVTQTPCTIPQADWDWILDGVTARIKMIEGRILRRYDGIPGATAPLRTDGASLAEEGQKEWSAALEDLQLRTPELPFRKVSSSSANLPLQY
jgi:hypothetical protein